jgi:hypothetical protein
MMATVRAAADNNSNVSALTTVATRLVYNSPVRKFAEEWWQDSDTQITGAPNGNNAEDESQPESTEEVSMEVSGGVSTEGRPQQHPPTIARRKSDRQTTPTEKKLRRLRTTKGKTPQYLSGAAARAVRVTRVPNQTNRTTA